MNEVKKAVKSTIEAMLKMDYKYTNNTIISILKSTGIELSDSQITELIEEVRKENHLN